MRKGEITMKKVLALILAVAMIASVAVLAGCGNSNSGTDTPKTDETAAAEADKTYLICRTYWRTD